MLLHWTSKGPGRSFGRVMAYLNFYRLCFTLLNVFSFSVRRECPDSGTARLLLAEVTEFSLAAMCCWWYCIYVCGYSISASCGFVALAA